MASVERSLAGAAGVKRIGDVRRMLQGVAPWPLCQAARNPRVPCQKPPFSARSQCCLRGIYFVHGGGFEYGAPREDGYDSLCSRVAAASGASELFANRSSFC